MIVHICSPLGGRITPGYLKSMIDFRGFCDEKKIGFVFHSYACSDIYGARNYCLLGSDKHSPDFSTVRPFQGGDYEKLIWIDSDTIFTPKDVMNLLSHDADIVSGLCKVRINAYGVGYFQKTGVALWIPDNKIPNWKKEVGLSNGLCPIEVCGGAFLAIRKGVYEAIGFPWYQGATIQGEVLGEDLAFCVRATLAGFKIYADPSVRVGHEKMALFE